MGDEGEPTEPEDVWEHRAAGIRRRLDGLPEAYRAGVAAAIETAVPNVANDDFLGWDSQAGQYPPDGPPGISPATVRHHGRVLVNCLLARDAHGSLVGILNQYPEDLPGAERRGRVNLWVRPDCRGRGVGTSLVLALLEQGWEVDPLGQPLTGAGIGLARSLAHRLQPATNKTHAEW